ncbi:MAG TPA: restriction endonuclease subunit M, partial [Fibrobacteres bacterium]|nr:restriction endonuclease subunit M [Fibrobacterota bacterium]
MAIPKQLHDLINKFKEHSTSYTSSSYNEAQLRQEFLNPFFDALGWDVSNKQGYAEAYKEVIHEDAIKIGTATKAPDYSFRIGGIRKFFVEAKKPYVNIKDDIIPAFQLRRYAWSGKLPLSILTDFEEFAIYDCRIKPNKNDKASVGRILYIRYDEYEKRWDEIASIFSKESILKGSFDKYAESAKGKKGTSEVDNEFLGEIERWRDLLARSIALRNPELSQRELNFAVQRTIDRIIFLRICEDRGIEHYGTLMALLNGENVYKRIRQNFQKADEIYNSGLFHFKDEKGRAEPPDTLTLSLQIDDKPLKDIIANLYYPESPYEFSVLPADILGQVYEQFLGKVIRLTAGHQAKVEDKPEVKKAGGVFYTPTYIVDYIVKNTVGKLIEGKSPKQIEKIKILDPACGSGSFLIQAYQFLLDYIRDWYIKDGIDKNSKGKEPKLTKVLSGEWRLSTSERKKILLNNIHGVDIDSQAVEVTKLSLLLKVLEGENEQSLAQQMTLWHERALPDLENNIKCGNSLIGTDFYEGSQTGMNLFEDEEQYRINAFDWGGKDGFQEIMKNGGFDVVIGNPPYVYRNSTEDNCRDYYHDNYLCAEGNFELYKFFIEKSQSLLKNNGLLGMIVSASFLVQTSFLKLRKMLLSGCSILRLCPLGPGAFSNATVDTTIIITSKTIEKKNKILVQAPEKPEYLLKTIPVQISQSRLLNNEGFVFNYKLSDIESDLLMRIFNNFPSIEAGYEFGVGSNTGYIKNDLVSAKKLDPRYHPMVKGTGISRYGKVETEQFIMYDKEFVKKKGKLGRTLPSEHLLKSDKILIVRTRNLSLKRRIIATIDKSKAYNLNRLSNIIARDGYSLEGLLGILNSSFFDWLFSTNYYDYEIKPVYLRKSPLADTNNKNLIKLVVDMLKHQELFPSAKADHEKNLIQ